MSDASTYPPTVPALATLRETIDEMRKTGPGGDRWFSEPVDRSILYALIVAVEAQQSRIDRLEERAANLQQQLDRVRERSPR